MAMILAVISLGTAVAIPVLRHRISTNFQAQAEGMLTLRQDGLIKVQKGVTTTEEVLRETTVQD